MRFMIYLYSSVRYDVKLAGVAELADAHDSKSCSFWSVGSTPTTGILKNPFLNRNGFLFFIKEKEPRLLFILTQRIGLGSLLAPLLALRYLQALIG